MSTEAARTARELQMLEGMVDCAHVLGMTLGAAAKAERDVKRMLVLIDGYQKCFLGVRMGIRLCQTLRAPPKATPAPTPDVERPERAEPPEREHAERPERLEPLERERDRDYEPVSLPKFLSTLGLAARDAERLGDQLPPAARDVLPTLKGLLIQANATPPSDPAPDLSTGLAVLTRPREPATRRNLLGSAAPPRPGPRAPPRWPNSG